MIASLRAEVRSLIVNINVMLHFGKWLSKDQTSLHQMTARKYFFSLSQIEKCLTVLGITASHLTWKMKEHQTLHITKSKSN